MPKGQGESGWRIGVGRSPRIRVQGTPDGGGGSATRRRHPHFEGRWVCCMHSGTNMVVLTWVRKVGEREAVGVCMFWICDGALNSQYGSFAKSSP